METNEKQRSRAEENFTGKPESKLLTFVKKHLLVFSLLAIIICIILGFMIKINIMERSSLAEKELLVNLYENKMDSLSLSDMELTSRVFSWAIRSEMTRQNLEQVNLFIKRLVKEPNISKIQLIDPATATVLLSSDKKEEGTIIAVSYTHLRAHETRHDL